MVQLCSSPLFLISPVPFASPSAARAWHSSQSTYRPANVPPHAMALSQVKRPPRLSFSPGVTKSDKQMPTWPNKAQIHISCREVVSLLGLLTSHLDNKSA